MWQDFKPRYRDDQNEKYPLKKVLEQAHALKGNNLSSNIAGNLQNSCNIYSNILSFTT